MESQEFITDYAVPENGDTAHTGATPRVIAHTFRTPAAPMETRFVFTPKKLDAAKCGNSGRLELWDALTPGLGLRITADRKTWSVTFTVPGTATRARHTLGTYPATGLKEARERAVEARAQVEAGTDPRKVVVAVQPKTVQQLWQDRWDLVVNGPKPKRTAPMIKWRVEKYILPLVGDVPVPNFRVDPHYNSVIDPIVKRGKLRLAGQVHTDLVTLMNYGVERGLLEFSRLTQTKSKDPKNVRKRNLSPEEIVLFWAALPKALVRSKNCQRILKLCLILGQRIDEVAGMTRQELNLKDLIWTLPAARVKNGDKYGDHLVPLPPLAMEVIREALAVNSNETEWLFPNDKGTGYLDPQKVSTSLRRSFEAGDFTIPSCTPHDLRRTVGTQMLNRKNRLGITKQQKYLVLNHMSQVKEGVSDEVYDQNDYTDDKRDALIAYAAWLGKLVSGAAEQGVA